MRDREKDKQKKIISKRTTLLMASFIILYFAIIGKAYQLQVVNRDDLEKRAFNQVKNVLSIRSQRGIIYDRNQDELVIGKLVDSFFADPERILNAKSADLPRTKRPRTATSRVFLYPFQSSISKSRG